MRQIKLNQSLFNYEIQRKPIRSVRLRLLSKNSFLVTCPRFTLETTIINFIHNNSDWILKNSLKIHSKKSVLSLQYISILGVEYQLNFIQTQRDSVVFDDINKTIYANLSKLTEFNAKKVLEKRFRTYALNLIKTEIRNLSQKYHFDYGRVLVKNQSSRFGSCSSSGNLNFNWQIIFFPPEKFRHILLHELTHLKIKNHSNNFWAQLTIYDPETKLNNLWLKKEGTKLFLF